MKNPKLSQSIENLENAIKRLEEALIEPTDNPLMIDGTIQRFEFTIEVFWKTLKRVLAQEGIQTDSPRDTLKKAFSNHWIEDETTWLEMLRDRNTSSHVYNESIAVTIYHHIQKNFPLLKADFEKLKKRTQPE